MPAAWCQATVQQMLLPLRMAASWTPAWQTGWMAASCTCLWQLYGKGTPFSWVHPLRPCWTSCSSLSRALQQPLGGQSPLANSASNGGGAATAPADSASAGQQAAQPAPAAEPAAAEVKLLPVHSNALVEAVMAGDGHSGHAVLSVHELDSSEARLAMRDSSATYWGDHHFHTGEEAVALV
jgi:hypothetical protein